MCILPGNLIVEGLKKILPYEKYEVPSFAGLTNSPPSCSLPSSIFIRLLFALSIKYGKVNESPSSVSTKSAFMIAICLISLQSISLSESFSIRIISFVENFCISIWSILSVYLGIVPCATFGNTLRCTFSNCGNS